MLDRYVEIVGDLGIVRDLFDQVGSYSVHITVHDSDKLDSIYFGKASQKFRQASFLVKLNTVIGSVLCREDQFLDAS